MGIIEFIREFGLKLAHALFMIAMIISFLAASIFICFFLGKIIIENLF